jgi:hypothetical protein
MKPAECFVDLSINGQGLASAGPFNKGEAMERMQKVEHVMPSLSAPAKPINRHRDVLYYVDRMDGKTYNRFFGPFGDLTEAMECFEAALIVEPREGLRVRGGEDGRQVFAESHSGNHQRFVDKPRRLGG